jgi:hypothetical protein
MAIRVRPANARPPLAGSRGDRRRAARVDAAIGLAVAALTLILAPGLAIVAIVAVALLAICAVSVLGGRWHERRRERTNR